MHEEPIRVAIRRRVCPFGTKLGSQPYYYIIRGAVVSSELRYEVRARPKRAGCRNRPGGGRTFFPLSL